jgi:hypothetical protein
MALALLVPLALATCDGLTPESSVVTIEFSGDSVLVVGATGQVAYTVAADGQELTDPPVAITIADTSIVAIDGTTLRAKARGSTELTVQLLGSVLPDGLPERTVSMQVVLGDVTLTPGAHTMVSLGETVQLTARATDANDATVSGVTFAWGTSNGAVATVDGDGLVTAVQNGTATVWTVADQDTAQATIIVAQALAALVPSQPVLAFDRLGATSALTVEGRDALGNPMAGVTPTWTSLNAAVATVSTGGVVTAKGNGTTGIVAKSGSVQDTVTVTVDQAATQVTIVSTSGTEITSLGDKLQLAAGATDAAGNVVLDDQVTWSSLEPTLALVGPTGEVTGIGVGPAPITATLDEASDTVVIDVRNDPVVVTVNPSTATLASIDDTLQLQATARNGRGDVVQGLVFTWGVNDSSIIDIDNQGRAIAVGAGAVDVAARVDGVVGWASVTVTNAPAVLQIAEATATTTSLGDTVIPTLTLTNARGAPLPSNSITWVSDQESIARVTVDGIVIAVDTGEARIRAFHDALADTMLVTVQNLPDSIALSSYLDTLPGLGAQLQYGATVWNARGVDIPDYPTSWEPSAGSIVSMDPSGMVTATAAGDVWLRATAGSEVDSAHVVVKDLTLLHVDNSTVVSPRFGTLKRPYAKIQDAIDAADANDTVYVHIGTGKYPESISLTRQTWLIGDSSAFLENNRNWYYLPWIQHDTGSAGITIHTTAPQRIRYLAVRHSLDGPAIDADGADVKIQWFAVNPWPSVANRVGRGILIKNSISGSNVIDAFVYSVRGYGIRIENSSNVLVRRDTIWGVDSIPGVARGAGVEVFGGEGVRVDWSVFARMEGPSVAYTGSPSATIQSNTFLGTRRHVEMNDIVGTLETRIWNNSFDLNRFAGEDTEWGNPPAALSIYDSPEAFTVWSNRFWMDEDRNKVPRIYAVRMENAPTVSFGRDTITGISDAIRMKNSGMHFWDTEIADVGTGIWIDSAVNNWAGISAENSTFSDVLETPCIYAFGDSLRVEVVGSTFTRCGRGDPWWPNPAIQVDGGGAGGIGGRLFVEGNTFTDNPTDGIWSNTRYAYFGYNTIQGPGDDQQTIIDGDYAGIHASADSLLIWSNEITDYRDRDEFGLYRGITAGAGTQLHIFKNRLARNSVGVWAWQYALPSNNIVYNPIDSNDFVDNEFAVVVDLPNNTPLRAEGTWWGDNRGPRRGGCDTVAACTVGDEAAAGDSISPLQDVLFEPFAVTPLYPGTIASGLWHVRGDAQSGTAASPLPRSFTVRVIDVDHVARSVGRRASPW